MDYKKIAQDVSQKILSYSQDTSGWKVAKSTKDITVSWKPSKEYPGNLYRGEGIIEEVPEKVIPFMYQAKYRTKWDSALKSYSILEEIDEARNVTLISHMTCLQLSPIQVNGAEVQYQIQPLYNDTVICHCITHSYGMGIISAREFVDIVHVKRYDGGVVTTNSISVEYDRCPITSSYVRGFNNPCGYVCSPLPENPGHSRLVAFIQPNLGGLLPRSAVDSALPSNVVSLIRDVQEGIKTLLHN